MTELPTVGIALAVYKPDVTTFAEQLDSIRTQSYSNWFCVLTSDSPLDALRDEPLLRAFFEDPRFRFVENETRLGAGPNFTKALQLSLENGAQYLACSDQDDVWYPNKLEVLVDALRTKPPLSLVHADMDVLLDGKKAARSAWEQERRNVDRRDPTARFVRNVVTGASMMFDAELARRFPELPGPKVLHDHFYAIIASHHGGVYPVRQRLHAYRQHRDNVIGVRPYRGITDGMSLHELLAKRGEAIENFDARVQIARHLEDRGLTLTRFQRLALLGPDGGLSLLGLALVSLSDPALARECLPLAGGKLLRSLSRS